MAYGSSKMIEECQTTDKANAGFGTKQLSSDTPSVLTSGKLEDGGASGKGAKPVEEQQP